MSLLPTPNADRSKEAPAFGSFWPEESTARGSLLALLHHPGSNERRFR